MKQMSINDLKQARDWLNAKHVNWGGADVVEAAKEAVEKQIPKKAQHSDVIVGLKSGICPVCEGRIFYLCSYCYHYGQKLDWGKEQ